MIGLTLLSFLGWGLVAAAADDDSDDDGGETDTITPGEDVIGSLEGEEIIGGAGSDTLSGEGGDDLINAQAGDDFVQGGSEDDVIFGGDGDDQGSGGSGDDFVIGGDGNDSLNGSLGFDWVEGDDGDDTLSGGFGDDTLTGGEGADELEGGADDDLLIGGAVPGTPLAPDDLVALRDGTATLNDILGVEPTDAVPLPDDNAPDTLVGGDGDDDLIVGSDDTATGGPGADLFVVLSEADDVADQTANITDFDAAEDAIIVLLDPNVDETPDVSVTTEGDDAVILVDSVPTAVVTGAAGTLVTGDVDPFFGIFVGFLDPT